MPRLNPIDDPQTPASPGSSLPPSLSSPQLLASLSSLPSAPYAVAVSGGADSTALLHLLHHHRPNLPLHVVHLDHQTRGHASTADADFVRDLAHRWNLPLTLARRDELEPNLPDLPANPSARFRALRHHLFRQVCRRHNLQAVLLAHHADDQAETVLQRLLRGSRIPHVVGMSTRISLDRLLLLRPLLYVRRQTLREYLISCGQPWREDQSNQSLDYLRNRLRLLLAAHPHLTDALLALHNACSNLRDWTRRTAPTLPGAFPTTFLADLPDLLSAESARQWLIRQGVPPDELTPDHIQLLLTMAQDAACTPRQDFPSGLTVQRRRNNISTFR